MLRCEIRCQISQRHHNHSGVVPLDCSCSLFPQFLLRLGFDAQDLLQVPLLARGRLDKFERPASQVGRVLPEDAPAALAQLYLGGAAEDRAERVMQPLDSGRANGGSRVRSILV